MARAKKQKEKEAESAKEMVENKNLTPIDSESTVSAQKSEVGMIAPGISDMLYRPNVPKTILHIKNEYEYKVLDAGFLYTGSTEAVEISLNDLGKNGWKYISDLNGEKVIFMREKS